MFDVRRRLSSAVVAVALVAPALLATSVAGPGAVPAAAAGSFSATGSIEQVSTSGHPAGATVELLDAGGAVLASGPADSQGAKLFRDLAPGPGYQVREGGTTVSGLTVLDPDVHPSDSFYEATRGTLSSGFTYITTRDGTKLSANITFPNDGSPGPWPVLVDYSGYDPSQPGTVPQEAQLYPYLGYVVVGVNLRGTTCSGGAFWFFEDAVRTDGYDVIETLAHQTWSNGDVGMVGISYSGYSQLPVAATRPPHLRAITPLSPFSDGYRGILYPGGILNDGFALNWALEREADAKPSAHSWVRSRINGGDTTCAQNQVMRLQSQSLSGEIVDGRFDEPRYAYLSPGTFAPEIDVPTFLATMWQDEQTGGYGAEVATIVAQHAPLKAWFTNGTHVDSLGPELFMRVAAFVDLYVGRRLPTKEGNGFYQQGVAEGLSSLFGTTITSIKFSFPTFDTYEEGLAWYEAQPAITVRWENGGVPGKEGQPYATVTTTYPAWPPPAATPERWYLQPDGQLAKTAPTVADGEARASSTYTYDPSSKRSQTFTGSTSAMWTSHPDVHWDPLAEGRSLSFVTPAFGGKTAYLGGGSADLWLRSSAADTDLEVTLTEVRPDGQEVFIQSGWLRASRRALDAGRSTVLRPWPTYQAEDAAPLPAGQFVPVRIELFPFAHLFRAGSRLRVNIEAPGGNQPFWSFSALAGTATNEIGHSAAMPSSVVLSRISDGTLSFYSPAAPPSCSVAGVTTQSQSLRNQPCRDYLPGRIPTGVAAAMAGNRVDVSWAPPPAWPSGPALTGYRVTELSTGESVDVAAGATSLTWSAGTRPGPFAFRVAALFSSTVGPASDASLAVSPATPTGVSAKVGNGSATVSWKAPAAPGATVTGYRVTPVVEDVAGTPTTFASTATTQPVTGLTNGATTRFRVAAVYAAGAGADSGASDPLVVGAPSAPGFLTVTPGNQRATLKWWSPSGNGASVTGYVITPYVGAVAQSPRVFSSSANQQTVTGLTNGTTYTFTVAAVNARGTGQAATSAPVVVNPSAPGAPSNVAAKAGNASASVSWKAPTSDGGSPVTGYVVTPYVGAVAQAPRSFSSTATTQTVTGLANGTTYTFTVAATNAVGAGAASAASPPLLVGAPGAPGFLTVTPGNQQATLKWWAPSGNGASITGYVITPYVGAVAQSPRVFSSSANQQTVTGLTNGTTYTFSVAAVNAIGTGAPAISPAVLVSPTAPGAPSAVTSKAGDGSASVSWKAPTSDGGLAITGYVVTPSIGAVAQAPRVFSSTATTQVITGLANGTTYTFTVAATNPVGTGAASAPGGSILVGAPGVPGFFTLTPGPGQVTVKWWSPSGNGSPITGYVITPYVGGVAQPPRVFASSHNQQTVTGLTGGTTYTFSVAAVNAIGTGVAGVTGPATPT
jgi:predicted acyl esterase